MVLALVAMLASNDGTASEEANDEEYGIDASQEAERLEPSYTHSDLLSTFGVTADLCYVFLRPKLSSQFFGPLAKEEKLKWLDTQGDWIRAWIPRLRVSGWVHKTKVEESTETMSGPVEVPEHLLSNVTVIAKRANIRQGPTTRSNIISVAKKDQEFWLLNKKENWYQIWLSDPKKKGWIYRTLVKEKQKKPKSP
jgi:uncharacterized protein YgiM (DUF1202 family)